MEPLTAVVSLVGGIFNWDARRRQTDAALEALQVEREQIESDLRLGIATLEAKQRLAQIEAQIARITAQERGDTERARAFYGFQQARALSGAFIAIVGLAFIGGAIYFSQRGST